ncbi:uncharacterized protein G2W53_035348 [Senna tora]|uniref:Uncharacterized protein n=1 Tax=Senna tora TaxID=362788 RepID=A0A834STF5_9FABA|nr:uncharacterized protein G2W53_035348 [Senna tora]
MFSLLLITCSQTTAPATFSHPTPPPTARRHLFSSRYSISLEISASNSFHLFQPEDQPSSSPPPMASWVIANDNLYMNMTLSNMISKLREAEVEKMKLKVEVEKKGSISNSTVSSPSETQITSPTSQLHLSASFSQLRLLGASKPGPIGSCFCKECHLREPQKQLEVEKTKKVGLWVGKGENFDMGM